MDTKALALSICLAVPASAFGQEVLTLDAAVSAAMENAPALAASRARVEAARADVLGAGLVVPGNPELSLEIATDALGADEGESARGISLSQELWAPGQRSARRDAAKSRLRAAELDLAWTRRVVRGGVSAAYVRLAAAQRKQDVLAELGEVLAGIASASERRAEAGSLSVFERNRVRIETAASKGELAEAQAEVAAARGALAIAMGADVGETVSLDMVSPDAFLSPAGELDLSTRADVAAATAAVAAAEASLLVEKRERRPRPRLHAGWESERTVIGGDAFEGLPFPSDDVAIDDEGSLARFEVTFALPVFDRNQAGIARAIAERSLAGAEADRVSREAATEHAALVARESSLAGAWAALDGAREDLRDNRRILDEAWQAGAMDLAQVLVERERLLRASLRLEDVGAELAATRLRLSLLSAGASE